jgi:aarF domain-containing kinase
MTRRTTLALTPPSDSPKVSATWWTQQYERFRRTLRMIYRLIKLGVTLSPVVAFYPLLMMMNQRDTSQDAQNIVLAVPDEDHVKQHWLLKWYLQVCLRCVEASGAAVIKLMQWAGSRPDLFGHDFCSVFSLLQDRTTPHSWKHTERAMRESLGDDWESRLSLREILGSGCIGQVYRGELLLAQAERQPEVAVKVLHPNVEADIDADLDLLRLSVKIMNNLPFGMWSSIRWLNLEAVVEDFSVLLKAQLDLRVEARNLAKFNSNFKHEKDVLFPQLVSGFPPTKNVLVETFMDGIPVLQYARSNPTKRDELKRLCLTGIKVS